MNCPNCGSLVDRLARFCASCGNPLQAETRVAAAPTPVQQAQAAAAKVIADIRSLKFFRAIPDRKLDG